MSLISAGTSFSQTADDFLQHICGLFLPGHWSHNYFQCGDHTRRVSLIDLSSYVFCVLIPQLPVEEKEEKEENLGHASPLGQGGHCVNKSCDSPPPADQPFFFPHTRSRPSLPPAMPTLPEEEEDSPEELDSSSSSPSTVSARSLLLAFPLSMPTLPAESDERGAFRRAFELLITANATSGCLSELSVWVLGTQALHVNPEIRLKMRLCNPIPRTHANTFKAFTFIMGLQAALPAPAGILL